MTISAGSPAATGNPSPAACRRFASRSPRTRCPIGRWGWNVSPVPWPSNLMLLILIAMIVILMIVTLTVLLLRRPPPPSTRTVMRVEGQPRAATAARPMSRNDLNRVGPILE